MMASRNLSVLMIRLVGLGTVVREFQISCPFLNRRQPQHKKLHATDIHTETDKKLQ